jgi:predicted MFS family arabinose efflux permease
LAYSYLGATWCFALNGISYIAVIISLFMITVKFVPAKSSEPVLTSMKGGFRFIRQREGLEALVALSFLMTLCGFTLVGFVPVFVQQVFHKGPETYQLLAICSGAGSVTGGLIVAAIGKMKHPGRTAVLIMGVWGILIAAFALSHWLPLSSVLIFGAGGTTMGSAVLLMSTVQLMVPDEMRGRVMSVYNLSFRSGMPMGSLVLGSVIPIFGLSRTVAAAGSTLVALAMYFLLVNRRVAAL